MNTIYQPESPDFKEKAAYWLSSIYIEFTGRDIDVIYDPTFRDVSLKYKNTSGILDLHKCYTGLLRKIRHGCNFTDIFETFDENSIVIYLRYLSYLDYLGYINLEFLEKTKEIKVNFRDDSYYELLIDKELDGLIEDWNNDVFIKNENIDSEFEIPTGLW